MLITQGTADNTVLPVFTDQLVADYGARGIDVTYSEGVNHVDAAKESRALDLVFLKAVLG